MNITGGKWRGRTLVIPKSNATRPTQNRVREAIVSQVRAARTLTLETCVVLDAFSGSGSVGLELLSQGARAAYFIENNQDAWRALSKNIRELKAEDAHAHKGSAASVLARHESPAFDVVYLDPPYTKDPQASEEVIEVLLDKHLISEGGIVIHQRDQKAPQLTHDVLELVKEKRYASSLVTLFKVKDVLR